MYGLGVRQLGDCNEYPMMKGIIIIMQGGGEMKLLIVTFLFLFWGWPWENFACLVVSNRPRTKGWIGGVGGVDYVSWFWAWARLGHR